MPPQPVERAVDELDGGFDLGAHGSESSGSGEAGGQHLARRPPPGKRFAHTGLPT
jgi:hypothetical protein